MSPRFWPYFLQEEYEKLEKKGELLEARIFELECMRGEGLTAAEIAALVSDKRTPADNGIVNGAVNGRPSLPAKAE